MPSNETTTKFKVDISDLKKNIQEANRQIKLANAEFKAASAGMDNWSKSADGLSSKISSVQKTLSAQKTVLESYKKQLELIEKEYGENSKEADEMRIKVLNQEAAVKKTEASLKGYEGQLKDLEDAEKKAGEAAEDQVSAYDKLKDKIGDQEKALEELKKEYASVVLEQGKNSDAAKDLAKEIDNLSDELVEDKKAFKEAENAADELDNSLDNAGDSAKDAKEGFTVMKGVLADLAATAIKAVVDGLKDLAKASYEAWQEYDDGADSIIAATGATGKAAEELMDVYNNVSKSVVADYSDIGAAVGEVNTRFGVTGDELQGLSEEFLKFAQLNGTDVKTSIDVVQASMAAWGVESKDAGLMLDLLNKAGQDTGVSVDKLSESLVTNAPALQEMGYNISDATMFLANLEKNGVDASATMTGLKKALANAAKEGKPMSTAMSEIEDKIKNAKSSTEAITIATELFGSKAGAAIATAVRDGKLSFDELGTSMADFQGNVESTFEDTLDAPDKLKLALQGLKTDFATLVGDLMEQYGPEIEAVIEKIGEIAQKVFPKIAETIHDLAPKFKEAFGEIKKIIDEITPIIKGVFEWIIDHKDLILATLAGIAAGFVAFKIVGIITTLVSTFQNLFAVLKAGQGIMAALNVVIAANPIGLIVAAIAGLVAAFIYLWNTSEDFRNFWINLWEGIKEVAGAVWEVIKGFFTAAWETIKATWEGAKEFFSGIWEGIKLVFSVVGEVLSGFFTSAWETIKGVWDTVTGYFGQIWEGIKTIFSGVVEFYKAIFTSAWNAVKLVWDTVKGYFELVWEGIKTVFSVVKDVLGGNFGDAWEKIKSYWDKVKDYFSGIWDGIKSIFEPVVTWFSTIFQGAVDAVKKIFDGLVGIIKAPINVLIKGINKFIEMLNKIQIPDWVPGVGGKGINLPTIPELAEGGVLKRGQMGLLEGDGAEAVVPLENNKKWIAAVTADLKKSLANDGLLGAGGIGQNVTNYNFVQNNNSPKALSRLDIYRQTRNQLDFAKGV